MKKIIMGCLFTSVLLLGACNRTVNDTPETSTTQSSKTSSSSTTESSTTSSTSAEKDTEESKQSESMQVSLTNEELAIAAYLDDLTENQLIDQVIADCINQYNDTGFHTKLQLSKTQLPDLLVSMSSMGSTVRYHFEGDTITGTSYSNSGDKSQRTYSVAELTSKYGNYQNKLNELTIKAENYSPLEPSAEEPSNTAVDTKNLTSEQLKAWVSAVLDQQFRMGRSSFPYKLSVENQDGYTYVRVQHSELQVDTITMFRVNGAGQLEESDHSNGFPVTYKVMSSNFMDTSEVTVLY